MTVIREFISDFTKIRRTPVILLYLVLPVVITSVFLVYYKYAGYHIIPDVRLFFIILQICFPVFAGIAVPVLINLDRNISNIQNSLGLTETRKGVYLGKLFFLMFLSALSMILYELCFYVGVRFFLGISIMDYTSYLLIFIFFYLEIYFCIYYTYSLLSGWGQVFRYSQELQAQYQQVILKTRLAIRFGRSFPGNGASGF